MKIEKSSESQGKSRKQKAETAKRYRHKKQKTNMAEIQGKNQKSRTENAQEQKIEKKNRNYKK